MLPGTYQYLLLHGSSRALPCCRTQLDKIVTAGFQIEPDFSQIMSNRDQLELTGYFLLSPQLKASETHDRFDMSKRRLDRILPFAVNRLSGVRIKFLAHVP